MKKDPNWQATQIGASQIKLLEQLSNACAVSGNEDAVRQIVLEHVKELSDDLQIDVRTETSEARELLWERAARLRAALEQHGVHVGRFEVTGDLTGNGSSSAQLTSDGLPARGGEAEGHGRANSSRSGRRGPMHGLAGSDTRDDAVGNVVVGERRLDVRI